MSITGMNYWLDNTLIDIERIKFVIYIVDNLAKKDYIVDKIGIAKRNLKSMIDKLYHLHK